MSSLKSARKPARPSPALFVAVTALVMAMSGAAMALPGRGSVDKNDLAKGSVTKRAIAKGAVASKQIKGKSIKGNRLKDAAIRDKQLAGGSVIGAKIADGAVTAAKLADGSVTSAKIADDAVTAAKVGNGALSTAKLSDDFVISSAAGSFVRLTATDGPDEATARTAAPESTLMTKGVITISAKCFRDTAGDETFAEMYVATSADGAIFDATDELSGGNAATDFLNAGTLATDRVLDSTSVSGADANMDESEFTVLGPDGTHLIGESMVGAKNGVLAGGNGAYGAGNVCIFGGRVAG